MGIDDPNLMTSREVRLDRFRRDVLVQLQQAIQAVQRQMEDVLVNMVQMSDDILDADEERI